MVPFNSAALAVNSTIAGHTPIGFTALPPAITNIREGKLRGLAVLSDKRSAALPDVPTFAEAGVRDQEAYTLTVSWSRPERRGRSSIACTARSFASASFPT